MCGSEFQSLSKRRVTPAFCLCKEDCALLSLWYTKIMPRVSERKLEPEVEQHINELFLAGIEELCREDARNILSALLTEEEKLMLSKRVAAIMLFRAGYKYTDIEKVLKIVPVTINKIKNKVKENQKIFREFSDRLQETPEAHAFYQRAKSANS